MVQNATKLGKIQVVYETGHAELNFGLNIWASSKAMAVSVHANFLGKN